MMQVFNFIQNNIKNNLLSNNSYIDEYKKGEFSKEMKKIV